MQKYALSVIHQFFRFLLPKHSSAWTTWLLWRTRKELSLKPLHDLDTRQLPLMGYHQHQEFARYKAYSVNEQRIMELGDRAKYIHLRRDILGRTIKTLPIRSSNGR